MYKEAKIFQTFIATFSKENEVLQIKKKTNNTLNHIFLMESMHWISCSCYKKLKLLPSVFLVLYNFFSSDMLVQYHLYHSHILLVLTPHSLTFI